MDSEAREHRRAPQRDRKNFWELWSTRVLVFVAAIAAVVGIAIVSDPDQESWHAKTWEFLHDLVPKTHHGHPAQH
ncbi:MAG: hypothetical protein JO152_05740 [Mycobacteriaceae bacterium]|nr:hypothetical protein [Mycobacteriaceae bacterium]